MSSDTAPWRRQSSQQSPDVADSGNAPPPPPMPSGAPPPPPPPGAGGVIPSMRINSEIEGGSRGRSPRPTAPGEPPAAIQNAMMTKDKKPFTYTPGGLDLSQIRSPRIQRRIDRNRADEGVGPLPVQQEHGALPPGAQAAMQPNLPVQVLPPPPPPAPATARVPTQPAYAPPLGAAQATVSSQAVQQTAANLRPTGIAPMRREQQPQAEPGSLYIAPVAPAAPAAPAGPRSQLGSLYIPPVVDAVDGAATPSPPPPPQRHFSPTSPQASLHKAPTPWMSSPQPQQAPVYARQAPTTASAPASAPASQPAGARIIPIQIEGRESPQVVSPPAPHTPQSPQEAHLSQWQREQQMRQQQRQTQLQQQQWQQQQQQQQQVPWRTAHQTQPQSHPSERVIPIQMESTSNGMTSPQPQRQPLQQQQQFQRQQPAPYQQQHSGPDWQPGPPVQSQSFRVLQKITDDPDSSVPRDQQPGRMNEMNAAQLRKLQLNAEDQALMNKFKAQVDDEIYLHQESDPRYRGAAIPSRAFRMLQNMTGENDGSSSVPMPSRISPAVRAAQQAVEESATSRPYIPPSEQTVVEPRKYTGGAIPSRSFRMLQAMTGSENCDPADTSDL